MKLDYQRVCDIHLNTCDSASFVKISSFLRENNLLRSFNPEAVISYEQLSFMVCMDRDQIYVPCSDKVFFELMEPGYTPFVKGEYRRVWRRTMRVLATLTLDKEKRKLLHDFCRMRLNRVSHFHDIIPSRLLKRLTTYLINSISSNLDPWQARKAAIIARQTSLVQSERMKVLVDEMPSLEGVKGIRAARHVLNKTKFARLVCLSAHASQWKGQVPESDDVRRAFAEAEKAMADIWDKNYILNGGKHGTVMILCDSVENMAYDLLIIAFFLRRGQRVIYAVKDGFCYDAPTMSDLQHDPTLSEYLPSFYVCQDSSLSKNALLQRLREWRLMVINDGTREPLNLLRVSVTFARAWKEADLILGHGREIMEILAETSHEFTRDILVWDVDRETGALSVRFRPHSAGVRKFSDIDLQGYADGIIKQMREARSQGRPVIFYSCIIGSIPGETQTALRLANAIVGNMRKQRPTAFIINPATHFVEGMDADDLMYMWEQVQRSGLITIWYFQTSEDIEEGFRLLDEPTPECWIGKDATYSTGCTKEMGIALDMQKQNREMQILGPDPSSFFRRSEYGVGKYFDASLSHG